MGMETKTIKVGPTELNRLSEPAEAIRRGELVAFPTETVYGLGADALNPEAVLSIFKAKGRPNDNPLIVHIAETDMLKPLIAEMKPEAQKLISAFWPGPLTIVFQKSAAVPPEVTAGLDSVAIRMPDHPLALELIKRAGVPIAAPSANRSGKPSPTLAEHVLEDMSGRISWIIDGGPCRVGLESTVLDMTGDIPTILRPGGITPEMIEQLIGKVRLDAGLIDGKSTEKPKSPGMKYTHYAPKGEVIVVSGGSDRVSQWINQSAQRDEEAGKRVVVLATAEHLSHYAVHSGIAFGAAGNPEEIAMNIFRLFRDCDRLEADKIYVEAIPRDGIGLAIMNRLEKAAGGKIVKVE
jgi:L-threonylcarbamoyladenylate synthase